MKTPKTGFLMTILVMFNLLLLPEYITLREHLRTHKVAVDQIVVAFIYLKCHQFSIKSYVVDVY